MLIINLYMKKLIFRLLIRYEGSKVLHFLLNRLSNNGLKDEKPRDTDHILGASSKNINETAQWQDYKPSYEIQHKRFDSMGCVSFSLMNAIEFLAKFQFGESWNRSDRFTTVASGTNRAGNSLNKVIDSARKKDGTVAELEYPWADDLTRAEYFQTIPNAVRDIGKNWLKGYEIKYEYVSSLHNALKEGLKKSPIWTAGYAWYKVNGKYVSYGNPNHAFCIIGYKEGEYWIVFDSYAPHIKLLDWNFKFYYSRVIILNKKDLNFDQKAIDKLRVGRGWNFILLNDDVLNFTRGVYELLEKGLKKIELLPAVEKWILSQKEEGKLEGVNANTFRKLIR